MHWIIERLLSFGDRDVIVTSSTKHSYRDLVTLVDKYSKDFEHNFKPGSVVVIQSDHSLGATALFLVLFIKKCIVVPASTFVEEELNARISDSQADWIVEVVEDDVKITKTDADKNKHQLIKQLQISNHSGLVLFSSGSTGKPKAMVHNLDSLIDSYKKRKPKKLAIMVLLLFDHIGGINTLLNSLAMGATIVVPGNREPDEICRMISENHVNILPASPTMLNLILMSGIHKNYVLDSLKMITYGTEPMAESLLSRLREAFPKVRLMQTFGTSETGIAQTSSKSSKSLQFKINDPDLEYKVVDGELWLKSKTQILGYLNASSDRFTSDGWFKTGDIAEEAEGYLKISGRKTEVINVGGEKVLPIEVESTILQMPQISDCIVYPKQNAITGQMVVVDVQLANGFSGEDLKKEIREFCKDRLARFKIPVKVNVVQNLNIGTRFKKQRRR